MPTDTQPLDDDLFVQRLGEIKQRLGERMDSLWGDLWSSLLKKSYGDPIVADEDEVVNFTDRFFCHYKLPSGQTPVEEFADDAPGLTDEERTALRAWTNDIESLFEILRIEGRRFDLRDLVSCGELTARPNVVRPLDVLKPGVLVRTRLVPVRDFYMFSGAMAVYAAEEKRSVLRKLKAGGVALPDSASKRWKPSPDHAAPPRTDACPCGSGRRYRKCCMRR